MAAKREIVLDTETTGLDPNSGHRIVEVGCVELINHLPSGQNFHRYVNPQRDMPEQAFNVHGLSISFLEKHSVFAEIAEEMVDFLGDAPLVIHNAAFDMGFLNAELARLERPPLERNRAIDTMLIARQKYPGAQASLDALCRRFEIDNTARTKHGALLDAELLAEVYLELIGAREPSLALSVEDSAPAYERPSVREVRPPRPHDASEAEAAAHAGFLEKVTDPIWKR